MTINSDVPDKKKSLAEGVADATKHHFFVLIGWTVASFAAGLTSGTFLSERNLIPPKIADVFRTAADKASDGQKTTPGTVPSPAPPSPPPPQAATVGPLKVADAAFSIGPDPTQPSQLRGFLNFTVSNSGTIPIRVAVVKEVNVQTDDAIEFTSEKISGLGYCMIQRLDSCQNQDTAFITISPGGTSTVNVALRARKPSGTLKAKQNASISTTFYLRNPETEKAWMEGLSIKGVIASVRS